MGPIASLIAEIETAHKTRPGANGPEEVTNDDHAQIICRFENGVLGSIYSSRIATGPQDGLRLRDLRNRRARSASTARTRTRSGFTKAWAIRRAAGYVKILTGPGAPRLQGLLPRSGSRHRLPGPDHHRGARFPRGDRDRKAGLADLPRWPSRQSGDRGGVEVERRTSLGAARRSLRCETRKG